MLIELSCDCHVAAEDIGEIAVNGQSITVRMKNGVGHRYEPRYRESVYAAKDRLVKEVNAALAPVASARLVCARCLGTGRITYGNGTSEDCACRRGQPVFLVDPAQIPE